MATISSITISPQNPYILTTGTQQFTATANYSDGTSQVVTTNAATVWSSSNTAVATVSNTTPYQGLATALTISGYTTITASFGGVSGTSILRVGLTNYTRLFENTVEPTKVTETNNNAAHNPIAKLSVPNVSLTAGAVSFYNATGASNTTPIGWTIVSGHPDAFAKTYIAHEAQAVGQWVGLRNDGTVTNALSAAIKQLGVVQSIAVDISGNQLSGPGFPVLVQLYGEAYVFTNDNTINQGDFLGPDNAHTGSVLKVAFNPSSPTPILGYALEAFSTTYQNMVLMRIQICGE